jgi:hypothetical protein
VFAHRSQRVGCVDAVLSRLFVRKVRVAVGHDDLAACYQIGPHVGTDRYESRHRTTPVRHFEGLAMLDAFEVAAGVLPQLADSDRLHVLHRSIWTDDGRGRLCQQLAYAPSPDERSLRSHAQFHAIGESPTSTRDLRCTGSPGDTHQDGCQGPIHALASGTPTERAFMPALINGSPTHVLIVHVVVVLLPISVLAALVLVFVPASRRAFALLTVGVAAVACLAIPLAFVTGGALRSRLPPSPLIDHHVALAHQLLPIAAVFGLSVAAFVAVDMIRRAGRGELNRVEQTAAERFPGLLRARQRRPLRRVHRATAVVLVVMSLATVVAVVRVGDSGAKAAWHGRIGTQRYSH